jgi:hypothetical protein
LRRANGGAVPARTQRNRGPGRLGCGQPRLPRLHRDRGRPTWGATASPHAQGPRSLADQSGACLQAVGCSLLALDRGTTRWNSRAPARQGPSPEERHPVYPQRFNWFESTPRNAPRLPIQTNNHTTSEPHTHVMSNENKFALKKIPPPSPPQLIFDVLKPHRLVCGTYRAILVDLSVQPPYAT